MKRSYVWLQGELREKGEDNTVVIGEEKWACFAGRWAPLGSVNDAVFIMPDMAGYVSPVDGREITSRTHHRAHLREHNLLEVGNERPKARVPEYKSTQGLREELRARLNS